METRGNGRRIKAVGYLRRSTDKQDASIPEQRTAIQQYADKHGYTIIRWYIDDAISGDDTEKRLDFQRMIDDAREKGDFEAILVWDQDRFGRFSPHEASYWTWPLAKAGIWLVTTDRGAIDWSDFTEWLTYSVNQHGHHQYLHNLSRNVLRGQIEAAKAGSWLGSVPYAYRLEGPRKNKRLIIGDASEVQVVRRIFYEFVEQMRSMTAIAARLTKAGILSPGGKERWRFDAVKVILQNPAYVGDYRWNTTSRSKYSSYHDGEQVAEGRKGRNEESDWIVIPDHHEAIIDRRTFNKGQAILAKGKTGRSPYTSENNPYLLTGKLRCGHCGAVLHGLNNGKIRYYECSGRKYYGTCQGTTVREDDILDELARYVEEEIVAPDVQLKLRHKAKQGLLTADDLPKSFGKLRRLLVGSEAKRPDRKRIEKQIAELDSQIAKAKGNLALIDREFVREVQQRIHQWQDQRNELAIELRQQPTEQDINETVLNVLTKLFWLATQEPDRVKPVIRELDHITVHTTKQGKKTRTRHRLERGEIVFQRVGGITGKVNPHLPD